MKVNTIVDAMNVINTIESYIINGKEYEKEKTNIWYKCYYNMGKDEVIIFVKQI